MLSILNDEINRLKQRSFVQCEYVMLHKCSPHESVLLPCCVAALAILKANVIAAATSSPNGGLDAVLHFLERSFTWGVKRSYFLCDMLNNADNIDCGARTALSLFAVNTFIRFQNQPLSILRPIHQLELALVAVQVIERQEPLDQISYGKQLLTHYKEKASEYGVWMEDNCSYHCMLGIFSVQTKVMNIWDYGTWKTFQANPERMNNSILSVKAKPYHGWTLENCEDFGLFCRDDEAGKANDCSEQCGYDVLWDGQVRMKFNQWEDIGHWNKSTCRKLPFPSKLCTSSSENHLTVSSSENHLSMLDKPNMATSMMTPLEFNMSTICSYSFSDEVPPPQVSVPVAIYVSGTHMGPNPMPGVGVARCLQSGLSGEIIGCVGCTPANHEDVNTRAPYISHLVTIAVDDSDNDLLVGLNDPSFDNCRDICSYAKLHSRRPQKSPIEPYDPTKCTFEDADDCESHEHWENIVDMMTSARVKRDYRDKYSTDVDPNLDCENIEVFYLPVSILMRVTYIHKSNECMFGVFWIVYR